MAWPDVAIGLALAFGLWHGWRRGLIAELTGTLALVASLASGFVYPGMWDTFVRTHTHLGEGSAHVVALLSYSAVTYAAVYALGAVLGAVARLPVLGTANAALGATLGFVKTAAFAWLVLYVALFFPLSRDLRGDLHRSRLVAMLEGPNARLDGTLRRSLPWFMRPFSQDVFARHHV